MNRLFLATNNGDVSGGEKMLFAVAEAARGLGWEVQVLAPRTPEEVCREADRRGFRVRRLAADTRPAYMLQLARFAARHPAELVWCHGLVPSLALTLHRRKIVHFHQVPQGINRLFAAVARRARGPRLVPSHYAAQRLPGTEVFPNWVPAAVDPSRAAEGSSGSSGPGALGQARPLRVGYLGRLTAYKGLPVLLAAASGLLATGEELELRIAGEPGYAGPADQRQVQEQASRLPAGRSTWCGRVDPAAFFPDLDLLVVPSQVQEVFGLVAAEAMSARVPVLVSDDGALPEVLGPGHPWVFRAGDSSDLARVLAGMLAQLRTDPEAVSRAVESAWQRWHALYSPEAGTGRVARVLGRMAPASPP